jgi:hypothetical protein
VKRRMKKHHDKEKKVKMKKLQKILRVMKEIMMII